MKDCLNESVSHAKTRVQHGSFLAKKQLIQQHIAKIILNMERSRWLIYRVAFIRQKLQNYIEGLKMRDDQWQLKMTRNNREYSLLRAEADNLSALAKFSASNALRLTHQTERFRYLDHLLIKRPTESHDISWTLEQLRFTKAQTRFWNLK